MRDLFLSAVVLASLIATLRYPFAGILLWSWFTCMDPHQEAFGFVQTAPINLIIAGVTIPAWLLSKEKKSPHFDSTQVLIFLFLVWITFNGFFAVSPSHSWPLWNTAWKVIVLGLFISVMATNKVRMHALVWVVAASLLYYGIKGGVFTILTGGINHVMGPPNSQIGDNNTLALATLMVLPLVNYLRLHSANKWISRGLLAATVLSTLSVLGSYSRGAFVALGGLGSVAWFHSKRKILYLIAAAVVIIPAFYFMPQNYFDRIDTIRTAKEDSSFHGRLVAWQVAWHYASDHFPLGDGMAGAEMPNVFHHYFPDEPTHAAHSIYFQVLGDNGFVGLGLYLAILVTAFFNCSKIKKATRGNEELAWAFDLAGMIQLCLFAFCLGGAALSMAYYDILFICVGLLSAMRKLLQDVPAASGQFDLSARGPQPAVALSGAQAGKG